MMIAGPYPVTPGYMAESMQLPKPEEWYMVSLSDTLEEN